MEVAAPIPETESRSRIPNAISAGPPEPLRSWRNPNIGGSGLSLAESMKLRFSSQKTHENHGFNAAGVTNILTTPLSARVTTANSCLSESPKERHPIRVDSKPPHSRPDLDTNPPRPMARLKTESLREQSEAIEKCLSKRRLHLYLIYSRNKSFPDLEAGESQSL